MDGKVIAARLKESRLDDHFDKAFHIMEFEQVDSTHWRIFGRVFCHQLSVGDVVSAWGKVTKLNQPAASFKILRIEAYHKDYQTLRMTWGGRLTLEGKGGEILRETHLLLRRLTSPPE